MWFFTIIEIWLGYSSNWDYSRAQRLLTRCILQREELPSPAQSHCTFTFISRISRCSRARRLRLLPNTSGFPAAQTFRFEI